MNANIFNACLCLGWLLIVAGVSGLHSPWLGMLVGGVIVMGLTVFFALRVGVRATPKPPPSGQEGMHVSD